MTPQDQSTLRALVDSAQSAWNSGDSAAFASLFAEDAEFVDVLGRYHRGRSVIEAGHRQIFDTIYKGSRVHYDIVSLRPLRPDVAVLFLHARLQSHLPAHAIAAPDRDARTGDQLHESTARPTMVLVKENDRWQIAAFQNTTEAGTGK